MDLWRELWRKRKHEVIEKLNLLLLIPFPLIKPSHKSSVKAQPANSAMDSRIHVNQIRYRRSYVRNNKIENGN